MDAPIQLVLFGEIVLAQKVMYEKFGNDFLVHFVSKGFPTAHCPQDLATQYCQKLQGISRSSLDNLYHKVHLKLAGNMKGKSDCGSFSYARLGVSRIYKLIRANRVSRNKFMASVVRKFDTPSWNDSAVSFLKYCAEILALLPFTLPDEPLYLIYAINRVLQVRAGTLEANMKAFLHSLQGDNPKVPHGNGTMLPEPSLQLNSSYSVLVDVNGTVQEELAGHYVSNHDAYQDSHLYATTSGNSCGISGNDMQKIQGNCLAAGALQLLLKLKRHLKIVYSLNDVRCQEFSPNEPPKPGEVFSRQNIPFDISDVHIDLPTTSQDLLQRYQEFKIALKEDTVDYSAYTANIKRKRAPPRRGGKSGHMMGVDVEDDDDDDEDWGSGARRVNNSGRRGCGSRTRQRL